MCTQCCSNDFFCDSSVCGGSTLFRALSLQFFTHFTRHFSGQFVVFNAVNQAHFINLKDVTLKVPGSQADYILQLCLRVLDFALFFWKSAWEHSKCLGTRIPSSPFYRRLCLTSLSHLRALQACLLKDSFSEKTTSESAPKQYKLRQSTVLSTPQTTFT